jgi:membrane protease YdiL (CAAX protease family)
LATVLWGNGVVLAGRRYGADQWITVIGVPAFGGIGCWWLWRRGVPPSLTGLRTPSGQNAGGLARGLQAVGLITGLATVAGLATFMHDLRGLRTIRSIAGTAFGEELIHRGVVLTMWAGAGVPARAVVAMNMVVFGLWHVAGAACDGFDFPQVLGPTVGAVLFVWLRLRFRSVFAPMAAHAINVFGVFGAMAPPCPFPYG